MYALQHLCTNSDRFFVLQVLSDWVVMLRWPHAYKLLASVVAIGRSAAEFVQRAGEQNVQNKTDQLAQLEWAKNELSTELAQHESRHDVLYEEDWRFFCDYVSPLDLYNVFCMCDQL